ncbi:MAG: TetR/AcrR family transcriptional regulator [Myxococcota bacterium]
MTSPESISTEQALREAALRCLTRNGVQGVSIKKVAAEAGVNHGLVHYYFKSKEGLMVAAFEAHCAEQRQRIEAGDFGDTRSIRALLEQEIKLSAHLMIEFAAMAVSMPVLAEAIDRGLGETVRLFADRANLTSSLHADFVIASFFGIAVHARLRSGLDVGALCDILLTTQPPKET